MLSFSNFSKDTAELAYSAVAFTAGQRAAQLALSDILKERKAAAEGTSDAANEFTSENDDVRDDPQLDVAPEAKASFEDWVAVLCTANDELLTLANGGKWPRPQTPEGVVEWLQKETPADVREDDKVAFKVLVEAFNNGRPAKLTDDEIASLVMQENVAKAQYFANLYQEHADDIVGRIKDQMANTDAAISFETAMGRLPDRQKLQLVNAVIRRFDSKCNELLTGKKRGGGASPVAKIPMLARATLMSVIRGDQEEKLKPIAEKLAHAA